MDCKPRDSVDAVAAAACKAAGENVWCVCCGAMVSMECVCVSPKLRATGGLLSLREQRLREIVGRVAWLAQPEEPDAVRITVCGGDVWVNAETIEMIFAEVVSLGV